jgi:hypothetical protein
VMRAPHRADAEKDQPPSAQVILNEVGVTGGLDRARGAAVGENRVVRTGLERTPGRFAC